MANEFNDDGPSWEDDYKVTQESGGWEWVYKLNPQESGSGATEQDAMDEAYEHWLEQRD